MVIWNKFCFKELKKHLFSLSCIEGCINGHHPQASESNWYANIASGKCQRLVYLHIIIQLLHINNGHFSINYTIDTFLLFKTLILAHLYTKIYNS